MDGNPAVADLEIAAYTAVIKVFLLGELTWAKDELLTKLRKELKVSADEHDQIKSQIMQDEELTELREELHMYAQPAKKARTGPSAYHGEPAPRTTFASRAPPTSQPSKRLPPTKAGGKKSGKEKSASQTGAAGGVSRSVNEHVSKKVKRYWPKDGGWLDAVITDYDPDTGEHVLTYDLGTARESWEKAKLSDLKKSEFQFGKGTISFSEMTTLPPSAEPAPKIAPKRPAQPPPSKSRAPKKAGSSSTAVATPAKPTDSVKGIEVEVDKAGTTNKLADLKQVLVSSEADILAQLNELSDDSDSD